MTIGLEGRHSFNVGLGSMDVESLRARTAGTRLRHYFNAAGSGLLSDGVADRVIAHLESERAMGGYEAANAVADEAEAVYDAAAELVHAKTEEIALFDTATSGLRAVFDAMRLDSRDVVIASRSTYVSQALRQLLLHAENDVGLVVLPNDQRGAVDLEALDAAAARAGERAVISVAHVPTSSGLVEPVQAIGAIARRHGARFILDATQSVGQIATDVAAIDCDVLVTTGRKFLRGPRGTAFAYISSAFMEGMPAWAPDVRGSRWSGSESWVESPTARRFETWEHDVAARLGLGVAIRELLAIGVSDVERQLAMRGSVLREALGSIDRVVVLDPPGAAGAIVTFNVAGRDTRDVVAALRTASVDAITIPAHHAQWDLGARGLETVVRVSPHLYNNDDDLTALLVRVAEIAGEGAR